MKPKILISSLILGTLMLKGFSATHPSSPESDIDMSALKPHLPLVHSSSPSTPNLQQNPQKEENTKPAPPLFTAYFDPRFNIPDMH